jgi:MFS family permease
VTAKPRIFTPTFALLCGATLCFFLSQGLLVPSLPRYAASKGISPFEIGVVLGAYFPSAILLRPFVGREIDRRSRKMFTTVGLIFSALACFAYPFANGVITLVAVRLLHGVAIASFYSGAATLTADLAPASRRAEALSYFSMLLYAGSAIGPSVAEFLINVGGFRASFWASAVLSATGLVISRFLVEPPVQQVDEPKGRLFHPAVTFPGVVLTCASIAWAATTFIPLYAGEGRGGSGVYYLTSSVTVLVMRLFVGRIADTYGRAAVIVPGTFIVSVALGVLSVSSGRPILITGALLFGIGWAALYPGLLSLTVDRVPPWQRGSALGTLTAAFDLSTGIGNPLLGLVIQAAGFPVMFIVGAVGPLVAGISFLMLRRRSDETYPTHEAA